MQEITLPLTMLLTLATAAASAAAMWALTKRSAENAERRVDALEKDLAAFKLEATRQFVTEEALSKVKGEVIEAINRLADRLDRIIDGRKQG